MKKLLLGLIGIVILMGLILPAGPVLAAEPGKVKFGHVAPPFHGLSKGAEAFSAHVKEKTQGRIDIAVFPAGQLGSEVAMGELVQVGAIEIASITTAVLQNFVPQCSVIDMPFIFPNRKTAYAALDDPELKQKIFSYFPAKGLIPIGWGENEIKDFTNTKGPVRTPNDIKGLKVRVMNSPVYLDTFKQLGASPVAIPFSETYNALQTGVVDAQDNPILTSVLMKFTEVTKYATLTNHSLNECITVVGTDYWNSLSKADQQIFLEAAEILKNVNREVNAKLHEALPQSKISVHDYAKANGVEIIELTTDEREQFRKAMIPVWDKYRKEIGDDIFDLMLKKIDQHRI
ncbi:MAG: C4-dicarboxylate ABC transporter substrate-binding protein [Desulfobacterales bacterium RIFOXYA12_FULL_46_15]|nr:MAG: C4-dicarboxylate ABC transporter substrate-binding protein [Desulfobacterales bacterium RIFOXYA12_FULL_46_15]